MKRLLVITTLCVLLTSAVGAGLVSAAPAKQPMAPPNTEPTILVYSPDLKTTHPSPDGRLQPYNTHDEEAFSDGGPKSDVRSVAVSHGINLLCLASATPQSANRFADASVGSTFAVDTPFDAVKDKPVTVTVTLAYTAKGTVTGVRGSTTLTIDLVDGSGRVVKQLTGQKGNFDVREKQETYTVKTTYGALALRDPTSPSDAQLLVRLYTEAWNGAEVKGDVNVNSIQVQWA